MDLLTAFQSFGEHLEWGPRVARLLVVAPVIAGLGAAFPGLRRDGPMAAIGWAGTALVFGRASLGVAMITGLVYALAVGISRSDDATPGLRQRRWRLTMAAIAATVTAFLLVRNNVVFSDSGLDPDAWNGAALAFDMFMILRFVTFFWEVGSGQIHVPTAERFAAWTAFPFTLFSPILRFSEFDAQLNRPPAPSPSSPERAARWRQGLTGAALIIVGAVLYNLVGPLHGVGKFGTLAVLVFVSPWSFYLQAAGLATVMQALAWSWRFALPDNFNRPFGRPNISEFWANWNITATSIFRDYLFYNRWGRRRVNLYLNVMVLFALVGVWHALGAYWLLWGLIHGVTFCAYLWYKKHGAALKPVFEGRHGRIIGATLTYLAVVAAWALPPQVIKLFASLG